MKLENFMQIKNLGFTIFLFVIAISLVMFSIKQDIENRNQEAEILQMIQTNTEHINQILELIRK